MLLYYVRHAQSSNNALYTETGSDEGRSEDAPLSDIGKRQLPYLATFMQRELEYIQADGQGGSRNVPVTLYSSLMERAVATASAIAEHCHLPLLGYTDLHEAGGIYLKNEETGERVGMPGKSKAFYAEHYPLLQYPSDVPASSWWNRGHEAREERPFRAARVYDHLRSRHTQPDEVIILVSHGEFFNHLIKRILCIPEDFPVWFEMMNAAVSLFDFQEEHLQIPFINRHHFLPETLITG